LDIWERELVRGWSLLLGAGVTNLDDIGAAVFVCRYGRDGDGAAQAWVGVGDGYGGRGKGGLRSMKDSERASTLWAGVSCFFVVWLGYLFKACTYCLK